MTNSKVHPDWNFSWEQKPIRYYAEKAAELPSGSRSNGGTIKKYEYILREYMAEVKANGLGGAIDRTVTRLDFMGISKGVVFQATKAWRNENNIRATRVASPNIGKLTTEVLRKLLEKLGEDELLDELNGEL